MSVELNHSVIHARDDQESAEFAAHILGFHSRRPCAWVAVPARQKLI